MAKRITIDKLAEMVASGFQEIHQHVGGDIKSLRQEAANGFGEVQETLADHSRRLDRIERKLDDTIARVDGHSVRLERLEKQRPA